MDKKKNISSYDIIIGKYRGYSINKDHIIGEWRLEITNSSEVKIIMPDKSVWTSGVLQRVSIGRDNELWIKDRNGTRRSIFSFTLLRNVKNFIWAFGKPGQQSPLDFDSAINGAGDVFIFNSCFDENNCNLTPDDVPCGLHNNCDSCIVDRENRCGWCSEPVVQNPSYGILSKQCVSSRRNSPPFICNGFYSTETCSVFSFYKCNPQKITCEKSQKGTDDINKCKVSCYYDPIIPGELIGRWRGIQISNRGIAGEWNVIFTSNSVTVIRPDKVIIEGTIGVVGGNYILIDSKKGLFAGNRIITLFYKLTMPINNTKMLKWSWSTPGKIPDDLGVEQPDSIFILYYLGI